LKRGSILGGKGFRDCKDRLCSLPSMVFYGEKTVEGRLPPEGESLQALGIV
jgi:hypothetical protein